MKVFPPVNMYKSTDYSGNKRMMTKYKIMVIRCEIMVMYVGVKVI